MFGRRRAVAPVIDPLASLKSETIELLKDKSNDPRPGKVSTLWLPPAPSLKQVEKEHSIWYYLFGHAMTLILVAFLGLAGLVTVYPAMNKGSSLTVLTQSMQPVLDPGDLVTVIPKECSEINIGDVVAYHPNPKDPTLITHRVLDKVVGGPEICTYTLKGDNNSDIDQQTITQKMIAGKGIYRIPKLGWLAQGVGGSKGRGNIVMAAVAILYVYALALLFMPSKDKPKGIVEDEEYETVSI